MDHMGFQMPGMPPNIVNQPPQIFGGYDGIPTISPDIAAQMFPDTLLLDDSIEAKRRRIAKACDMCRKKKIKCDGKMPACSHCANNKADCVFTQVEKKRAPPKGAKYIEGLENRLSRMEHILRLSGLIDDEDGDVDLGALERELMEKKQTRRQTSMAVTASLPNSPSHTASGTSAADGTESTPQSSLTSPAPVPTKEDKRKSMSPPRDTREGEEEVSALSEMMCSLVTNTYGETRFIGSSSGFSIFSPKGIEWVNSKTGDKSFQRMISEVSVDDHKWTNWKPEVFGDLFRRPIFRPIPPKPEAMSLLRDFFENFNCIFPLFHQPTFMHLVEMHYSSEPYHGSGWWASLNVALAIAHRLRVMSNLVPQEEDEKAWAYLKNAMGVFPELVMRNTDLLSVQALLGMALFMQGTPNPQPSFLLISAAMRLAHSIGLHKRGTGFNLNPIEIEQRKRVFWIAYMLDKDLCLRSGRPPAQDDDDMNVELPEADPADNIGNIPLADGKGKMNLFRVMCEVAIIESEVYKRLYSVQASKQSDGDLLNTIGELDQKLEAWKDSIPIDFRPEHDIKASHTPLILHVVMVHFTYYNCLTTIHRMSIHHGYWTSRLSNYAIQGLNSKPLNPRVFSSAVICTSAARASINLLRYVPQGDFACVWMILYFPVSALVTLFGNILQNPLDPRAKADNRSMDTVVTFLSMLGQEAEQGGVHRMLGICSEFERIAKAVILKAEKEQASKRKRRSHDSRNVATHSHQPSASAMATSSASPSASVTSAHLSPPQSQMSVPLGMSNGSPQMSTPGWQDYGEFDAFNNMARTDMNSPPSRTMFQQPLLPHDLFSLPMNLDFTFAEMSGGAYPTVENGNFDDILMVPPQ
ncbi:fungal-specific transcription factor domain-containing protein [Mariannaea sp. PMI_226]|nr:fungal-specific transcription factor domain-containing protein [Mariannaea sp. PMI_226]